MKCILTLLLISGLWINPTAAQTNSPAPESAASRKLVFEENFDNDQQQWLNKDNGSLEDQKLYCSIDNGFFKTSVTGGKIPWAQSPEYDFSFEGDFEIEYSFRIVASRRKHRCATALLLGRDSLSTKGAYLYISKSGDISFVDCTQNGHEDCKEYKSRKKVLLADSFNKVLLKRKGNSYHLYFNDSFVKSYPAAPLPGTAIGLGAGVDAEVVYDYFRFYTTD